MELRSIGMPVTRRTVLEQLAAASDATRSEATTVEALGAALEADLHAVEAHLIGLEACELARIAADGSVRVTITGEELLELDNGEMVIVDTATPDSVSVDSAASDSVSMASAASDSGSVDSATPDSER